MKKIIIFTMLLLFIFPNFVSATEGIGVGGECSQNTKCARGLECFNNKCKTPKVCWKQAECKAKHGSSFKNEYFDADRAVQSGKCPDHYGYCYAGAPKLKLQVPFTSILGKATEVGIKLYIKELYNFSISIAGLLAVIMIMVGGVLWMTARGNSEQVSNAQSFISNSILGLFLVLFSWFLLNTINPELLTLRGMQIPLVKTVSLAIESCKDLDQLSETSTSRMLKIHLAKGEKGKVINYNEDSLKQYKKEDMICGHEYYYEGGDGEKCFGHSCKDRGSDNDHICYKNKCKKGFFKVQIESDEEDLFVNKINLLVICNNNTKSWVAQVSVEKEKGKRYQEVLFADNNKRGLQLCEHQKTYLEISIDDPDYFGTDEKYAIGSCGNNTEPLKDGEKTDPTNNNMSIDSLKKTKLGSFPDNITRDNTCKIELKRKNFPKD